MTDFTGTAGNDTQEGTGESDNFFYSQGGRDTLTGKGGNDAFKMGTELRANDSINGGAGTFDTVQLFGATVTPYTVVLGNNTIKNCEALQMSAGDYDVTMADGNIAAGEHMSILASAATSMVFDGSAETDGFFSMDTSAGDDVLIGGQQADTISGGTPFFSPTGIDTVRGEGGDDTLQFFDDLTADDRANGGDGFDKLTLKGDYSLALELENGTISNIEQIDLDAGGGGFDYQITFADGNVSASATLVVNAGTAAQVFLNAEDETDGHYQFEGGAGSDHLTGGDGNDFLQGNGDNDLLEGGAGADGYGYVSGSESTDANFDVIKGFDASEDLFFLSPTITAVDTKVTHGDLDVTTFEADIASRINAGRLGANHAVLYKPDGGDFAGVQFLIVDLNATAGYQSGDLLILLDDPLHLGNLTVDDFGAI
jgi:Ca2+-binding RTX toxin-like protein